MRNTSTGGWENPEIPDLGGWPAIFRRRALCARWHQDGFVRLARRACNALLPSAWRPSWPASGFRGSSWEKDGFRRLRHSGLELFAGCALLVVTSASFAATTHVVRPSDIDSLKDVVSVALAPEGDKVIYAVKSAPTEACPGQTTLWITGTDKAANGHKLKFSLAGDHEPRWRPGGGAFAFVRSGRSGAATKPKDGKRCTRGGDAAFAGSNLWVSAYPALDAHRLTDIKGTIKTFRWAPDGKTIAAIVRQSRKSAPGPHPLSDLSSRSDIYLVDAGTGAAHRLDLGKNVVVYDLAWFPDNRRLAIRFGNTSSYGAQFYESRLEIVDVSGRVLQTINDGRVSYRHPLVSPDGKKLIYGHFFGTKGVAPVYVLYDLVTGNKHDIGADWKGTIEELVWVGNDKMVGIGLKGVHTELIGIDANTYQVRNKLALQGQARALTRPQGRKYAYIGNTREHPNEVWLYDGQKKRVASLTDINPQVHDWRLAKIQVVHWKSRSDGTELSGLLALPRNAKKNEPLKALVQAHGGPLEAWQDGWQGSWETWAQVLTGKGYAVFMPNPRGSSGGGHAFANGNVDDWGGADYRDILDGVTKLVEDGVLDPDALAIGGWSYGGYMSSWAAGHNDNKIKFKTAIVGAPPTDLFLMAFNSDLGYYFTGSYLGDPFDHRKLYLDRSPVSSARNVSIPVLIMHGDSDERVPTSNGKMLYHILKHYGKTVSMVIYPNATHWLSVSVGSEIQGDVQKRVAAWLERYLGAADDHKRD